MNEVLRVLIVDDSDDDTNLVLRKLRSGGYQPEWERVDTHDAMKNALEKKTWDVILCDYKMPGFSAPAALKLAQEINPNIPFIVVSGAIGEETAVEVMKAGAHDYVMKDKLAKLSVAVKREIAEAKIRRDKKSMEDMLKRSENNFRNSLDESPLGVRIVTSDGELLYANREILNMFGYDSIDELKSISHLQRYTPETFVEYEKRIEMRKHGEYVPPNYEVSIVRKDGTIRHLEVFRKQVLWNGQMQFQALYNDITERKQAEKNLRESEKRYRVVVENANEAILITQNMKILFANTVAINNTGYPMEELTSMNFSDLIHPDDIGMVRGYHDRRIKGDAIPSVYSFRIVCRDKSVKWVELNTTVIEWEKKRAALNFLKDITVSKQLEEERSQSFIKIKKTLDATVSAIASMVETRDPYTTGHQKRVSILARAIAEEMGLCMDVVEFIETAAIIHDIGKLSVPSEILSKPTKLTNLEFELIKTHSQSGYNILKDIEFPWPVADAILQHHERMNGTGYPQKLQGHDILLESRILAVADVVEAISSHRPYRPGLGIDFALEEITKNKGVLYDENVVDACIKLFREKHFVLS
ncbi:MAG TPA: PAS domain S-box protein [Smithella sp.]|nr:PAS domain S-box protein [Smithella sp.]